MSQHNPFASFRFTTDAPTMWVKANPTMYATHPTRCLLRIDIDGVISYTDVYTTEAYQAVSLGSGTKTVEITESGVVKPALDINGCYITSVKIQDGYSSTIIDTDTPANKLLFFGDSITVGSIATYLTDGFAMKFRDAGRNTSVLGYAYGAIYYFAYTAPQVVATVADIDELMDGSSSNKLIILLGTNDYAVDEVPIATFQTKYSELLVAINTARPDILIYAVSPIPRTDEGANSNGDTCPDFRTAISNACSGKSYCTYIDGTTLVGIGDISGDGVHPTDAGHLAMYTALNALI